MSRLHWLELLTDQFSVLETFPISNLPVEFSQEGATDVRENYIRLRSFFAWRSFPRSFLCERRLP